MTLSTPNSFRSLAFVPPPQVATTVLPANFASCINNPDYKERQQNIRLGNLDRKT